MKAVVVELIIPLLFAVCICGVQEDGRCRLVADVGGHSHLSEAVCYVSCLSSALNKLYTDGERKLLVNEEVYANASRILDDMEGRTGESVKYLSVISGIMEGKHDKLEKLISYGNEMGDLVAKVGGLFAEVNESVKVVRKVLPSALMEANRYYTTVAEITGTVWDDVKAVGLDSSVATCKHKDFKAAGNLQVKCSHQMCPLVDGVSENALKKYKDGCLEIAVQNGSVSECLNKPRDSLYKNGAVKYSSDLVSWRGNGATFFQLTLEIQGIFGPLVATFATGLPPSVLLGMITNITSFYSCFNGLYSNFTSMLLDVDHTDDVNGTNPTP